MHFLVYLKGEELSLPSHLTSNIKLLRCCHPTPIPGLSPVSRERIARTSRYREENAVPFSLKGVGIAPTIELSVVIGMGIPLLSSPRFHSFRQTNRTSWFAIPCTSSPGSVLIVCILPSSMPVAKQASLS